MSGVSTLLCCSIGYALLVTSADGFQHGGLTPRLSAYHARTPSVGWRTTTVRQEGARNGRTSSRLLFDPVRQTMSYGTSLAVTSRVNGAVAANGAVVDRTDVKGTISTTSAFLTKLGLMAFIVGMCIALPITLLPQWFLSRIGLLGRQIGGNYEQYQPYRKEPFHRQS